MGLRHLIKHILDANIDDDLTEAAINGLKKQAHLVNETANTIGEAFSWDSTDEGHDFWYRVALAVARPEGRQRIRRDFGRLATISVPYTTNTIINARFIDED